jgi:hypothetical protein
MKRAPRPHGIAPTPAPLKGAHRKKTRGFASLEARRMYARKGGSTASTTSMVSTPVGFSKLPCRICTGRRGGSSTWSIAARYNLPVLCLNGRPRVCNEILNLLSIPVRRAPRVDLTVCLLYNSSWSRPPHGRIDLTSETSHDRIGE